MNAEIIKNWCHQATALRVRRQPALMILDSSGSSDFFDGLLKSNRKRFVCTRDVDGVEFKNIGGSRHFKSNMGKWINCLVPPTGACNNCEQHHRYF